DGDLCLSYCSHARSWDTSVAWRRRMPRSSVSSGADDRGHDGNRSLVAGKRRGSCRLLILFGNRCHLGTASTTHPNGRSGPRKIIRKVGPDSEAFERTGQPPLSHSEEDDEPDAVDLNSATLTWTHRPRRVRVQLANLVDLGVTNGFEV